MERVVFAESWRPFFARVGLESFDDFYDYPGGTRIGENDRRNVYRIDIGEGPEAKTFYIKRYHHCHLKDVLSAWRNFGRPISQAGVEWANANLLLKTIHSEPPFEL